MPDSGDATAVLREVLAECLRDASVLGERWSSDKVDGASTFAMYLLNLPAERRMEAMGMRRGPHSFTEVCWWDGTREETPGW